MTGLLLRVLPVMLVALVALVTAPQVFAEAAVPNESAFRLALADRWGVALLPLDGEVAGEDAPQFVRRHLTDPMAGRGDERVAAALLLDRFAGIGDALAAVADEHGDLAALHGRDTYAIRLCVIGLQDLDFSRLGLSQTESAAFSHTIMQDMQRLIAAIEEPALVHRQARAAFLEQAMATRDGVNAGKAFSAGNGFFISEAEAARLRAMDAAFQVNSPVPDQLRRDVLTVLEERADSLALSEDELRQLVPVLKPEVVLGKEVMARRYPKFFRLRYGFTP
ncbi:MAG: hypothetical protein PF961_04610 [Planctomycetota bacterium]|nr:hypothetical protein [Planctomycetota bacterium]